MTGSHDLGTRVPSRNAADLVVERAAQEPNATALLCHGQRFSYADLAARTAAMDLRLRRAGVCRSGAIGVLMDRTPDLIVATLAIWRLGAVYVPLDPSYPRDRLSYCVADAHVDLLITDKASRRTMPLAGLPTLIVDEPGTDEAAIEREEAAIPYRDAAYIVYTSGTTGRPKGVVGTHAGLLNSIAAQQRLYLYREDDVACFKAPIGFIDAIFEAFLALASGIALSLAPQSSMDDPNRFLELIERDRVTRLMLVPSVARMLSKAPGFADRCHRLRWMTLNSEPVDRTLVDRLSTALPSCRFIHGYGATETSTDCCFDEIVTRPQIGDIAIGRPIDNMSLSIRDPRGLPVPPGVEGEIQIGGIGLAAGYLNAPDLTAEKFVIDPQAQDTRLYRTGDLGLERPNGTVRYLGRRDRQVKVGGVRIELDDVEASLRRVPGIADAAVVRVETSARSRLVAFVVGAGLEAPAPPSVRRHAMRWLPKAMAPAEIRVVPALPLSANGKIDVKALEACAGQTEQGGHRRDPTSALTSIIADVLGLESVASDQAFFDLGGDSLSAMTAIAEIEDTFGVTLPLRALFDASSLDGLAAHIEGLCGRLPRSCERDHPCDTIPTPLSGLQRMFWALDHMRLADDADSLYLVTDFVGALDAPLLDRALREVAERHPMLRCRFHMEGDGVMQSPGTADPPCLAQVDLSSLPAASRQSALDAALHEVVERGFDLDIGPPMRAMLVRLSANRHVLAIIVHHLVADGAALDILARDLGRTYARLSDGLLSPRGAIERRFDDLDVHGDVGPSRRSIQIAYWRRRLRSVCPVALPVDGPRRAGRDYAGARTTIDVPGSLTSALKAAGQSRGATTFMTIAAATALLLSSTTRQPDIVLLTDVSTRRSAATRAAVGLHVNFVPLRIDLAAPSSFNDIIDRTRDSLLEALDHADVPFTDIIATVSPSLVETAAALDRIVIAMQPPPLPRDWLPGLEATRLELVAATFRLDSDIEFYWREVDGGLHGVIDYSSELFDQSTITGLSRDLVRLLDRLVRDPGCPTHR